MSIKPLEVQRDQYGYWSHPDYLAFCDGRDFISTAEFNQWMAAFHIQWLTTHALFVDLLNNGKA
ncbi:hypothetical protein [Pantoea anthophila]|uniref:hypothetical protein n=1 Tax=Pantoea anthophila TaxID=470931 RepID=UPI00289B92E4|nr:hypothetical protein [Pantoea anthophila]